MTVHVTIENCGPVARANVHLHPLTIFVGPNNAGRSVIATAIHATAVAARERPYWRPGVLHR